MPVTAVIAGLAMKLAEDATVNSELRPPEAPRVLPAILDPSCQTIMETAADQLRGDRELDVAGYAGDVGHAID